MQDKKSILSAIIVSAIVTLAAIVLLTIFGELSAEFKTWLARSFSHHWIGKSIISVLIFLVSIPIFYVLKLKKISIPVLIWILVTVSNLSFGILLAFFSFETYL